jgi:transcriptional regulator NrdR family protein
MVEMLIQLKGRLRYLKCKKCNGNNLRVKYSYYDNNGFYIRNRKCLDCGYETKTIEVKYETFNGIQEFVKSFKILFKEI